MSEQQENLALLQQDSHTIDLDEPIMMGETKITQLVIRKPNVRALQGVKIADLLQGDVSAICTVLPKVSSPTLTKHQIEQLEPADLAQIGGVMMTFLQPKSVRQQLLQ